MRKSSVLLLSLLSIAILHSPFASAAMGDQISFAITSTIDAGITFFKPIFDALFNIKDESNDFFFAKILLGILLYIIISTVLKKFGLFKHTKGVSTVVALIVSILAIRFINENQLTQGILLPYGTLGVVLTTILPFLICFYLIHSSNMTSIGRRIIWIVFAISFLVLWAHKYSQLGDIMNQIYGWTLVAMIGVFSFDRKIHEYFGMFEDGRRRRDAWNSQIARMEAERNRLIEYNPTSPEIDRLDQRIRDLRSRGSR